MKPIDYNDFTQLISAELAPKSKHAAVKFGAYFALHDYTFRNYKYSFNQYWHRNDKFNWFSYFSNKTKIVFTHRKLKIMSSLSSVKMKTTGHR